MPRTVVELEYIECKEKLKSSLPIMGEIGVNDYNLAFHYKLTYH
ncbi:hypothetical protein NC653_000383 [Populus alba x Populus x berolinensis]|uniref:Uncharacterized protein n=1 Tax=Populus alba x Populus x berolinensis TaxID=444605 RepID=A0AAD6RIX5_9ROSI|nr:hypothetical protein NC653_000383 [Populus alba x Populus x berolinensis]